MRSCALLVAVTMARFLPDERLHEVAARAGRVHEDHRLRGEPVQQGREVGRGHVRPAQVEPGLALLDSCRDRSGGRTRRRRAPPATPRRGAPSATLSRVAVLLAERDDARGVHAELLLRRAHHGSPPWPGTRRCTSSRPPARPRSTRWLCSAAGGRRRRGEERGRRHEGRSPHRESPSLAHAPTPWTAGRRWRGTAPACPRAASPPGRWPRRRCSVRSPGSRSAVSGV